MATTPTTPTARTTSSTPTAPPGYTIRRLTREELPRLAAFTALCDRHDIDGVDFTLATFEMDWAMPRFDPERDAWAIETAASEETHRELVAYIHLTRRPKVAPEAVGWVHPEHRGRGLGSLLIDLTEARVRELAAEPGSDTPLEIAQWTNHAMTGKADLLTARGYRVTRSFWRMTISFGDEEPEAPVWPAGVELRPMRVGIDDEAVYTTIATAFRDHWGASPLPFPEWRELRMGSRLFDPELWRLAWSASDASSPAATPGPTCFARSSRRRPAVEEGRERLVGAAINVDEDGEAWVQTLGVLREARGKGVGKALLLESFRAFHGRGHRQVFLGVDAESLTGATRLYENAGMRNDRQWDHWERKLD